MAEILVVHPTLKTKGGGETVCMNVLESLQNSHEVTVLTVQVPDFDELNDYYATAVTDVDVRTCGRVTAAAHYFPNEFLNRLKTSFLNRYIVKEDLGEAYDLLISTYNDLRLPYRSIQYIHMPNFDRDAFPGMGRDYPSVAYWMYDHLCNFISKPIDISPTSTTYLANSDWTAEQVTQTLDARPQTVYPPVYTVDFDPEPWSCRENGFVTIGRISKEKNILRNIEIVAELTDRGHDVHYHVLGPISDGRVSFSESYQDRVRSRAAEHDFVHLEGEVSRERLVEIVSTHRYGLHGMDHEHFGIAVAELVAGGTIPFVPRGGGQVEIVDGCEDVLYDSVDDAVDKIDTVLSDEGRQRDIRERLPDVEQRFGRDRFQRTIRRVTDEVLS